MTAFIREQRVTQISGEALPNSKAAPSANGGKQDCQRTERNQSKQNVLGKKRKCAENSDTQQVAARTAFGISHRRVETISDGTDGKAAFPESSEKDFEAADEH
jgi:hypothetical protein